MKDGCLLMELYTCSSFSLGDDMHELHLWAGGVVGEGGKALREGMEQEEVSLRCGVDDARASPTSLAEETKLDSSPLLYVEWSHSSSREVSGMDGEDGSPG